MAPVETIYKTCYLQASVVSSIFQSAGFINMGRQYSAAVKSAGSESHGAIVFNSCWRGGVGRVLQACDQIQGKPHLQEFRNNTNWTCESSGCCPSGSKNYETFILSWNKGP